MTVKEAYDKVKKLPKRNYLIEACDFGEFFGFIFCPYKPADGESFGGMYDCVNKETGEIFAFSPVDDLDLFDKGKIITIKDAE